MAATAGLAAPRVRKVAAKAAGVLRARAARMTLLAHDLLSNCVVMRLTSLRDLLAVMAVAAVWVVGPALLVPEGASALEPLLTAGADTLLPTSALPSMILGFGALVALAFYGRPRNDP